MHANAAQGLTTIPNETPRATVLTLSAVFPVLQQNLPMLDPSDRSAWVREHLVKLGQRISAQQQTNLLGMLATACGKTLDTEAGLVSDTQSRHISGSIDDQPPIQR